MSLRLRLIFWFFLLSVVPLGALTLYAYTSNAKAMREAAGREAQLLAGELSQRMTVVTARLSERVEHLMDLAGTAQTASAEPETAKRPAPAGPPPASTPTPTTPSPTDVVAEEDEVAGTLGQLAMLLNNVELRDQRGRGRGGARGQGQGGNRGGFGGPGSRGDIPPPPAAPGSPQPPAEVTAATAPREGPPDNQGGRRGRGGDPSRAGRVFPDPGARGLPGDRTDAPRVAPPGPPPPPPPGSPPPSPSLLAGGQPGETGFYEPERITIDMMPIRRDIMQQYASQEEWAKLSDGERQRILGEVNQRMLGIEMGIKMGTAEAQRRIAGAQRAAEVKSREAATKAKMPGKAVVVTKSTPAPKPATAAASAPSTPPTAPASPMKRKSTLSGAHLDITMERNGEVVRQLNAEVNLQNLLNTVFSTTRRDRGEVPFAVAKDGHIYTPTDDDQKKIQALDGSVIKPDSPPGTTVLPNWIVVTTSDPTGSGLKFGIARPVGDSLNELRRTSARNAAFGLGFIGIAIIGIVPLSGRLTRNLSTLVDAVHRIADGDYRARAEVRSNDEIGRLATAFNQMAEDVEQHQRAAVGQERIRRELELGRQIQHEMLPHAPLRFGLTEIQGVSVPAREVGGDFFNYFQVASGQVALLVGDVSGKGVGAALLMANIQASLRTRLALGQDLASVAREIDVDIDANTPGSVYATLFMAMLNLETNELRYVNAGHHSQYVLRSTGNLEQMPSTGLPVGLLSGHGYVERRVQLSAGDLLFFYTDGCVETENDADEMFGTERLEALLQSSKRAGTHDVLADVEAEIGKYRGQREPFDDATMMAVRIG